MVDLIDNEAMQMMVKARNALLIRHRFFGRLALKLKLVPTYSVPTAGVDGVHMWFNPDFVRTLTHAQRIGLVAHEAMHCALGHPMRLGSRDFVQFNEAGDFAINLIILDAGMELPPDGLIDPQWKGMAAEEIYTHRAGMKVTERPDDEDDDDLGLDDDDQGGGDDGDDQGDEDGDGDDGQQTGRNQGNKPGRQPSKKPGKSGKGTGGQPGQGEPERPGNIGGCGTFQAPTKEDEKTGEKRAMSKAERDELARDWQVATIQAANICKAAGDLPGSLMEALTQLKAPIVDWREALRRFVQASATKDYSWSRPNRRFVSSGLYLPSLHSEQMGPLVFARDTSASVNLPALEQATGELNAIADEVRPELIYVIDADTEVCKVDEMEPDDLPILTDVYLGRGGTDFAPTFEEIERRDIKPACLVYFTDLECMSFGPEPDYPVIWVTVAGGKAPFGEVIKITV